MSRETIARAECEHCGGDVAVKANVSGKAYYTCDHCGFKAQHTWQRTSEGYLEKLKPAAAPAPVHNPPAPAPARGAGTVLG